MTSRNALVTACNVNFVTGAKALLNSVKKLHPDVARVCLVLEEEKKRLADELAGLAEVVALPRQIRGIPDRLQIAVAKLFTPIVDADVAVWLDCDCVICRPAPEIWDVPAGRVIAVQDTAYRILQMVPLDLQDTYNRQFPGLGEKRGFNGGFFSLRPNEWRDLPERYEKILSTGGYPYYPTIFDQPLLNGIFQPNVNMLPFKFNAHHGFDYSIPRDVRIVHFTNVPKPWMPEYPKHQPQYYYWVRYGERETGIFRLCMIKLKILLRTPRRILMRWLKSLVRKDNCSRG